MPHLSVRRLAKVSRVAPLAAALAGLLCIGSAGAAPSAIPGPSCIPNPNTTPAAPINLIGFVGGSSIALRWDTGLIGIPAATFGIFRNGVLIGNVQPGFHTDFPEKDGNGYVDNRAKPGQSYHYQVTAYSPSRKCSRSSRGVRIAFPVQTTPLPSISFDTSKASDLTGWMQKSVLPFLSIWYPKVADQLAFPDYTAPAAFSIRFDPDYTGVAYANGTEIVVNPDYARKNPKDLGMYLHEATHVLQRYPRYDWMAEGIADWTREYMLRDRAPIALPVGKTYQTGYSEGSYFLNWIQTRYEPDFVRIINIAKHQGGPIDTDVDAAYRALVGKTPLALWREMTGALPSPLGKPLNFTRLSNRCLSVADGLGRALPCDADSANQYWTATALDGQTFSLTNGSGCLDIMSSGTENGTGVWLYQCNGTNAQQWYSQPDGSLRNPNSGRCLTVPADDSSGLQIQDCIGSPSQILTKPVVNTQLTTEVMRAR